METEEQKPKKNTFIYIIIIILIIAIVVVYYMFFGKEKLAEQQPAGSTVNTVNTATQEVGSENTQTSASQSNTLNVSTTDVTGGLSSLKLMPDDVLKDSVFQSLQSYAEPVELPSLGRPNPFISY